MKVSGSITNHKKLNPLQLCLLKNHFNRAKIFINRETLLFGEEQANYFIIKTFISLPPHFSAAIQFLINTYKERMLKHIWKYNLVDTILQICQSSPSENNLYQNIIEDLQALKKSMAITKRPIKILARIGYPTVGLPRYSLVCSSRKRKTPPSSGSIGVNKRLQIN